jgi:hypothetical protein
MRLEHELIKTTHEGLTRDIPATVSLTPVIGPTHASKFHPYADGGERA